LRFLRASVGYAWGYRLSEVRSFGRARSGFPPPSFPRLKSVPARRLQLPLAFENLALQGCLFLSVWLFLFWGRWRGDLKGGSAEFRLRGGVLSFVFFARVCAIPGAFRSLPVGEMKIVRCTGTTQERNAPLFLGWVASFFSFVVLYSRSARPPERKTRYHLHVAAEGSLGCCVRLEVTSKFQRSFSLSFTSKTIFSSVWWLALLSAVPPAEDQVSFPVRPYGSPLLFTKS